MLLLYILISFLIYNKYNKYVYWHIHNIKHVFRYFYLFIFFSNLLKVHWSTKKNWAVHPIFLKNFSIKFPSIKHVHNPTQLAAKINPPQMINLYLKLILVHLLLDHDLNWPAISVHSPVEFRSVDRLTVKAWSKVNPIQRRLSLSPHFWKPLFLSSEPPARTGFPLKLVETRLASSSRTETI